MVWSIWKIIDDLPFVISFTILFAWNYTYVYGHSLIESYRGRLALSMHKINHFINDGLNKKYGVLILEIDNSGEDRDLEKKTEIESTAMVQSRLQRSIVRLVFSISMTLACQLIVLMMSELSRFSNEEARLFAFQITIDLVIFFVAIAQPLITISLIINQSVNPWGEKYRTALILALFIMWLFLLHRFGDLGHTFTPRGTTTRSLIETKISEISIAGITTMAILSGIGSASTPYEAFFASRLLGKERNMSRSISEREINASIQSLNHTSALLAKRQQDFSRVESKNAGTVYNQNDIDPNSISKSRKNRFLGLLHKVQSFASINSFKDEDAEERELAQEVDTLKQMRHSMYEEVLRKLSLFERKQKESNNSVGLFGGISSGMMAVFAMYCIYRIVNVFIFRILLGKKPIESSDENIVGNDALAVTIAKIIHKIFKIDTTDSQLINQVSFILTGSLFLCSITNVTTTFKSLLKLFPSFTRFLPEIVNWLKHLAISELSCIYIMATALLIRVNLPANLSQKLSKILSLSGSANYNSEISMKEVQFIDNWFNKVFAIAAVITLIYLVLRDVLSSDDDLDSFDEEAMMEDTGIDKML